MRQLLSEMEYLRYRIEENTKRIEEMSSQQNQLLLDLNYKDARKHLRRVEKARKRSQQNNLSIAKENKNGIRNFLN